MILFYPTRQAEALENDIVCEAMSYLHGLATQRQHQETALKDQAGEGEIRAQR